MTWNWSPRQELDCALDGESLFNAWVGKGLPASLSDRGGPTATEDLRRVMDPKVRGSDEVPFFAGLSGQEQGARWIDEMAGAYRQEKDARVFRAQVAALSRGDSRVVITGQQPGFMGGPLYSLYKAATAVALAEKLTAAGQPTVPVFWMGDDDDDLVEAFAPVLWNPAESGLQDSPVDLKPLLVRGMVRPCVGNLDAGRYSAAGARWLQTFGASSPLGAQLASLWEQAVAERWNWTRLFRAFLLCTFAGRGLIAVSGNDGFLHGCAAKVYRNLSLQRDSLRQLAEHRGRTIARAGFPLPISERSLHRHLFQVRQEGREFVPLAAPLPSPADLRPGVLLRSLVQDALFRPQAVVVGPGELAYLRQIDPLYEALVVPRCPLVPRLFGQILPPGITPAQPPPSPAAAPLADRAGSVLAAEVERILRQELRVDAPRARQLAEGRSRRVRKSLETLFRNESRRLAGQQAAGFPAWVQPRGKRQERLLASACGVTLWGDDFVSALVAAAHAHLDEGLAGRWHQFVGLVP